MNITPHRKGEKHAAVQAKDLLTQGERIDLSSLAKTGFSAYVSRVYDGPEDKNNGTLIFVHNVDPENLLKEV